MPPARSAWRPHRAGLQSAERLSRTSAALGPNAVGQAWMRTTRKLIVGAMLALSPMAARAAASCDQSIDANH